MADQSTPTQTIPTDLITLRQAAIEAGRHPRFFLDLARRGVLPSVRLGRTTFTTRGALAAALQPRAVAT